jgi:hypothetical protein
MRTFFRMALAGMLVASLAGCVTSAPIPGASADLLAFLRSGETTRQETILKLGQPSASFERESILTYRVGHDPKQGYYIISPKVLTAQQLGKVQTMSWEVVCYSLVLVFDSKGTLQKQNLVPVK